MRFPTLPPLCLLLLPSVISAPLSLALQPRQEPLVPFAGASAVVALFNGLSSLPLSTVSTPSPFQPGTTGANGTNVLFTTCEGTNVSRVLISPCEGGNGTEGNPCVFTAGRNYTITLTYTSAADIASPRAGLASYDGDAKAAYSGQSFDACRYTSCPVQAGVESNYTYPFRTFQAPPFNRLVFNATSTVLGPSFLCANIPVNFAST